MLNTRENLPKTVPSSVKISVLLVSPHSEDETILRDMLPATNTPVLSRCEGVESAMPQIRSAPPTVVICERDLPDGTWKMIVGTCEALPKPPAVLVISRHADENLWAEVLNLGGYDVLRSRLTVLKWPV